MKGSGEGKFLGSREGEWGGKKAFVFILIAIKILF